jgi:hypothetical protein
MKSCKNRQNKKEILGEYIYKQKNEKKNLNGVYCNLSINLILEAPTCTWQEGGMYQTNIKRL